MKPRVFNVVLTGVGGQGIITLGKVLGEAALIEGFDVGVSEIHGMAQRGGSLMVHVRFGETVYSPLIPKFKAHVLLGLEGIEAVRHCGYLMPGGCLILNNYIIYPSTSHLKVDLNDLLDKITSAFKGNIKIYRVNASEIALKLGNVNVANSVMLGSLSALNLLPLKEKSYLKALEKVIPKKFLGVNFEAFKLGKEAVERGYKV
ncbi:MAG: indolepyruvate oxidoreductase subunit beta [Thermoprotei archaeon]|nr:MAG: indolepyruvate oxidoreductase subunit beta [Thermoprotei archaeon]